MFFNVKLVRILESAEWDYWVRGFGRYALTAARLAMCFMGWCLVRGCKILWIIIMAKSVFDSQTKRRLKFYNFTMLKKLKDILFFQYAINGSSFNEVIGRHQI